VAGAGGVISVPIEPLDPGTLELVVGAERIARLLDAAARTRELLAGRRVVNVSSTATGGGVAELLHPLLGYARGAGIDADWLVITGDHGFFTVTKRIHNGLYGSAGDGGPLGDEERRVYERVLEAGADGILGAIRPDDLVVVHDPQPAGLVPLLVERGARVVWRCHVGFDGENEWTARAWTFLRQYVEPAHAFVFSRAAFAPSYVPRERLVAIAPSIDPFSPKNTALSATDVRSVLAGVGLIATGGGQSSRMSAHPAHVVREGKAPSARTPLVTQISRWDRLKDMPGVLAGFVENVPRGSGAHLVLAGPAFAGVADDPEAQSVWDETVEDWRRFPAADRARVHLVLLSMVDPEENAIVVNALQRHARIVVQKSLAEGFGLTVVEAMWKARPVIGSAVGGIVDQIADGDSGVLLHDPHDLGAFGSAVARLLEDSAERRRLGGNARRRAQERFLPDRHLLDYAALLERLVA
jgi:trehalose synthase